MKKLVIFVTLWVTSMAINAQSELYINMQTGTWLKLTNGEFSIETGASFQFSVQAGTWQPVPNLPYPLDNIEPTKYSCQAVKNQLANGGTVFCGPFYYQEDKVSGLLIGTCHDYNQWACAAKLGPDKWVINKDCN